MELRNRESITISLLVFLIDPAIRFALARVCAGKTRKLLSALTRRAKALMHQHAQLSSQHPLAAIWKNRGESAQLLDAMPLERFAAGPPVQQQRLRKRRSTG